MRFYHLITRLFCIFCDQDLKTTPEQQTKNGTAPSEIENGSVENANDTVEQQKQCKNTVAEKFSTILSQLKAHRKHCWDNYRNIIEPSFSIFGPPVGHFDLYLRGGYFDVLSLVFDVALQILKLNTKPNTVMKECDEDSTKGGGVEETVRFPPVEELQTVLRGKQALPRWRTVDTV